MLFRFWEYRKECTRSGQIAYLALGFALDGASPASGDPLMVTHLPEPRSGFLVTGKSLGSARPLLLFSHTHLIHKGPRTKI